MKSRGSRARTTRRAKYVIYIAAAIAVVALVFYMNFRRERNLLRIQEKRALVQEQFDADPRFRNISTGIDRVMLVSTVTGSVASEEDFRELRRKLAKTLPMPGTYNWRIEVEIKETPSR